MNHSEYLRRKLEKLPQKFGVPQLKDASMHTMVARYKASRNVGAYSDFIQIPGRGNSQYWRSERCRPDIPPHYRFSNGQQQEWSREALTSACAGDAICAAGQPRAKQSDRCSCGIESKNPVKGNICSYCIMEDKKKKEQTCCDGV